MSMEKVKDFVCGIEIDWDKAPASYDYKGKTYKFCSQQCKNAFNWNPDGFIILDEPA